jgi:hypothetical protein
MKNCLKNRVFLTLSCFLIFALSIHAAPIIAVDTQHVDLGSIREGTVKRVRHVFKIMNKGDEPLIISKVKAG